MPGPPDITVVIPTRDRWQVLGRTLDALAEQDLGGTRAEVVVVDNGSRDGSFERLRERAATEPGGWLRALREEAPGAAAARNRGIAEARAPLLLFLGDDCVPAGPGLVSGHLAAHSDEDGPPRAVVGRIEWGAPRTPVMDWLERAGHMVDLARLEREPPGPATFYTGNVSVPRRALLEVAGFDQRFVEYGFEDLDLGLRLADRGLRFEHRPGLVVHHAHAYGMAESLGRMEAVGRGARLLHALHDHRRPLPGPPAGRARLAAGRALAAVDGLRREPPPRAPRAVRDAWLRAAHLGAFARGYAGPPVLDEHPARRGYGAVPPAGDRPRPAVSVVVPVLGGADDARALLEALGGLTLGPGDEVVVVDNGSPPAGAPTLAGVPVPEYARVVAATAERSSYHARNVGADATSRDWILFLDADCRPLPGLLDDLFREPIEDRCGAVAGGIVADPGRSALVARYAASRRHLSQAAHMRDVHRPYGITANLLVRRAVLDEVGGFLEGLRSGGDQDLCWRLQDAGWTLAYREPAAAEHRHRERVAPLLRQMARYSAAIAWMDRRAPGSSPRPRVARRLARSAAGTAAWLATGSRERAAFKALDGLVALAEGAGWLMSNDAPAARPAAPPRPLGAARALVAGEFPTTAAAEAARALAAEPGIAVVEAARRPERPDRAAAHGLRARYAEDDGHARRALAVARLAARHPLRTSRALAAARRPAAGRASAAPTGESPWHTAAPALRLRRAGVRELRAAGDPRSLALARALAARAGLPAVTGTAAADRPSTAAPARVDG